MREVIRKILKENQDLELIKSNEIKIPKLLPHIVDFIKEKYGKSVRVKTSNEKIFFGSDNYSGVGKVINVFVENEKLLPAEVKIRLWNDIRNFFGVDMSMYGSCLNLNVYKKIWSKV